MNRRLRLVAALTGAIALCAPAAAPAATCLGADREPSSSNLPVIRRATLCLVNVERAKRGRVKLRFHRELSKAANRYAQDMVARDFFSHVSPTGSTLISRIGLTEYLDRATGWALGENLAWGSGTRATPRETVRAWMRSPGHRKNILDRRFRELGVGVALGTPEGGGGATYATEFGTRR